MPTLNSLRTAIMKDPGLQAGTTSREFAAGLRAVDKLDKVLLHMIDVTNVNDDGLLTAGDMRRISDAIDLPANTDWWKAFLVGHGNDAGRTSGFHWLQGDGGSLKFQGRDFIDTIADATYHFGFEVRNGRYYNEDGNDNETAVDVAGWLNFFLNGRNVVHGSRAADELGSGVYSEYFAKARSETFLAGDGNDNIWADRGNDRVYGGDGNDVSGGGTGDDRMYGEAGRDTLWGETGQDRLYGGSGRDVLGGGDHADRLFGGSGADTLYGENGYDRLEGGSGNDDLMGGGSKDRLYGNEGNDKLSGDDKGDLLMGGAGNDTLSGGAGYDNLYGGRGADTFELWEKAQVRDVVHIGKADSGTAADTSDTVKGFQHGIDKLNLRDFGDVTLRAGDYAGSGQASCYYDQGGSNGRSTLWIDTTGDGLTDAKIAFDDWLTLTRGDLILG